MLIKFRFLSLIFITFFCFTSVAQAENVFRPQKNSNLEQSNQFIPDAFMPIVKQIRKLQAEYLNQVTESLREIKQGDKPIISLSLLLLSFLYGLLHAAGPGHGKAVISAYTLSNKAQLRQGIGMAFFASMLQAITAITITFTGLFIFNSSVRAINSRFVYFEQFSYALIAALGLYLLISHIIKTIRRNPQSSHHVHDDDCGCGHDHIPAPKQHNFKQKLLAIFSIGIRPCTGALLILILAHSLQLYWTGIIATFLMAIGTFITISLVATFAVSLQKIFAKLSENTTQKYKKFLTYIYDVFKIILSLLILAIGLLLFAATIWQ